MKIFQSGCSVLIQNARFEKAFAVYMQKYLASSQGNDESPPAVRSLEVKIIETLANYDI